MYDLKLANVCEFLQANDPNGEYQQLFTDVLSGETSKTEAYKTCKEALKNIITEQLAPNETSEIDKIQSWINYLNY